jgi:hypothetical protein
MHRKTKTPSPNPPLIGEEEGRPHTAQGAIETQQPQTRREKRRDTSGQSGQREQREKQREQRDSSRR